MVLLLVYLWGRQGEVNLYLLNKAIAGTAFMFIGLVLLIGPLSRVYPLFAHWILYRKSLGITAFLFGYAHTMISLFSLPDYFPLAYYQAHLVPFIAALVGLLVLVFLFVISFSAVVTAMNRRLWWELHHWGVRLVGLVVFIHVVWPKWPMWFNWYINGSSLNLASPFLPPPGLLGAGFLVFVSLIRLAEFFGQRIARILVIFFVILLVAWSGGSLWWGIVKYASLRYADQQIINPTDIGSITTSPPVEEEEQSGPGIALPD